MGKSSVKLRARRAHTNRVLAVTSMLLITISSPGQAFGKPQISRFYQGASAAVSLEFDDSMNSQIEHALPLLNARKLRGTFFVNPGRDSHKKHRLTWEIDMPKAGHELGNHTMNHVGAKDAAELAREVRECSEVLGKVYGPKPKLIPFAQPGGVPWLVTSAEEQPVFKTHFLIPTTHRRFFEEDKLDPVTLAQEAIDKKSWVQIGFHGTGGEWLNTTLPVFTRLLDFLAANRGTVWIAPTMEVTKYILEREAANDVWLNPHRDGTGFTLQLQINRSKLPGFDADPAGLFDQPLTVEVAVASSWMACTIRQGTSSTKGRILRRGDQTIASFDVLPFQGPVEVRKA